MALLVLDAGTGSGKCLIFDQRGQLLGAHGERWAYEVRSNPDVPVVKEYSFDAPAFWGTLCRCAQTALAKSGLSAGAIDGIATTSQREGCVFLDAHGHELYAGPNIDARGFNEGLEVLNRLGRERLYAITGHSVPFIFPIARYLWFRAHGSGSVAHLLMINDWMTYRLTSVLSAEPSNATESMLFDLAARCWSDEILHTFDIPKSILPPVLSNGERVGALTASAAHAMGLCSGTPVYVGGADTQCSLLGSGVIEPQTTAATLGTTSPVQTVVGNATFDPEGNLWAGCHVVPDRWVLESNAGDTGDAFLWLLDLVGGGAARDELFRMADDLARPQLSSPTMLFVGPTVFNLSRMNLLRPGGVLFPFPSLHVRPDRGALVRGFMENVGYAIRGNLEQLAAVTGARTAELTVSGGMARSAVLLQTIADVTGVRLQVAVEPQSAALGCAILIAAQGSEALGATATAMVQHRVVEPDRDRHERYGSAYAKWRELDEMLDQVTITM